MLHRKANIVLAIVAVVLACYLLGREVGGYVPRFAAWVESLGWLGPVVFILGFIVATVAFVPGSILTLAGGAIFGIVKGTAYVFAGATLGATAAFIVSRYVARGALVRRVEHMPRFHAIDSAIRREGRKIVFLLRLSPAVPFNMINYALGLTSVKLIDYLVACIGMLPVILLWVYYGKLIGDVAIAVSGAHVARGPMYWIMLAAGLVATVVVTVVITRAAKRALASSIEETPEL